MNNLANRINFLINGISNQIVRNYAFKSDLKIKWVRPEKIPTYRPERSGDLEAKPVIDKSLTQLEFRDSKELDQANEVIKKLFSLEFAPRKHSIDLYKYELTNRVRRHPLDFATVEAKIARWTGSIRALQEVMENFPRNKKLKGHLQELIDKRKKHLKYLRRWDYKKFEWILEQLNIVYRPSPENQCTLSRRESLTKLTDKYCDDFRAEKLQIYKLQLEEEQPAFLQEKINALEFIMKEQEKYGVNVTVSQKDIDAVQEKLLQWTQARQKQIED